MLTASSAVARRLLNQRPMRIARLLATYVALSTISAPSEAQAQEHNSLAAGVNLTQRVAPDDDAHGGTSIGFKFRVGHSDTGWGWQYGLGWYSTNLDRSIGGRKIDLGRLRVRPVYGGYGYTRRLSERVSVSGKVLAGVAFTSFHITTAAVDAFHALPAESVEVKSGVIPVVKPEVSVWYDLNRRFGISADVGYSIARPKLTVSSSLGRETGRVRADALSFSTGLVYRIF
jgi:hypothetical protein